MTKETKRAVCEFCHCRCRVVVHTEDGKLVNIEEDRSFPLVDLIAPPTRACQRLLAAGEFAEHPDRLNYPLKRAAGKGEGKWQRIPWDQAFDEIAGKLKEIKSRYGAEAIADSGGTLRTQEGWRERFLHLLGTPNSVSTAKI